MSDHSQLVLVTGSAGRLGRAAVKALNAAGWRVRGFDRAPTPGTKDFLVGDLTDFAALQKAAADAAAVIHLAATPDDDDFHTQLLPNNIVGLYNIMEAARLAGVKRMVLASSGQVTWWKHMDGQLPLRLDEPVTPRHWYAVTKVALEAAGRVYARNYGIEVIAVRLGWCPRTREQVEEIRA
ncbi:MAG: NAD(P)-dependent oxidoreductase, partial [Verrucomicrobiota bacterium]